MKVLRQEVIDSLKSQGGLADLFDSAIFQLYNITDDELEIISTLATYEELDDFLCGLGSLEKDATFSEKKKGLIVRNKYVEYYNTESNEG